VRRFQGRRAVARTLAVWIVTAVALLALGWVSPTVEVSDVTGALAGALAIGLVNALLWPVLIRFALPFTVLTLGLGALVLNGLVVRGVSAIVPGFDIGGLRSGIVVAIWVTVVTTAVTALLAIDDDDFHYRNFVLRRERRAGTVHATDVPGVIFLEIDGLAHEVLRRAVRDGNVPTIARWLRNGTTVCTAGRPTGPRRPARARPGCCTATTTTCQRSAGGRRTASARSSPTTRATRPSSRAGTPTGAACCTRTAPAAPTSSPATPRTAC
jgi:uncharacterized membrane protein YvlD (DUF360 family)